MGSHQCRASSVHWVNADSDLAPVLSLGPLRKSLKAHRGQPPLTHCGPVGTPESCPRKTVMLANSYLPAPKTKPLAFLSWVGQSPGESPGGVSWAHQAKRNSHLAGVRWGEGGVGLNMETVAAFHLVLAQKPRIHSFPVCLWHFPTCYPSAEAQGEFLGMRESVPRPFKRMPGFSSCLLSYPRGQNPN